MFPFEGQGEDDGGDSVVLRDVGGAVGRSRGTLNEALSVVGGCDLLDMLEGGGAEISL